MKHFLLVLVLALTGCLSTANGPGQPFLNSIPFEVDNDHWQPVTVYILHAGTTERLGRLEPQHSESFEVHEDMVRGKYHILIVPAGGSGRVYSATYGARPAYGDLDSFVMDGRVRISQLDPLKLCVKEPLRTSRFCV